MQVGPDEVQLLGDSLVVRTTRAMEDWKASRYRKAVILFEGRAYFVAQASALPGGGFLYRLEPYEEVLHELPACVIRYDTSYAEEREEKAKLTEQRQTQARIFWIFTPFLGFLFAPTKLKLQERYGFHPITLTWISFVLEAAILLGGIPFFFLGSLAAAFGGRGFGHDYDFVWGLFFLIGVDLVFRFDSLKTGAMEQWGFLEWLVKLQIRPAKVKR